MCGIFGKVNFNKEDIIYEEYIKRACDKISHRGPDNYGFFNDGSVALGHRRLSIIDLSEAANQPMTNEDRSIWIVFNGEIYNFIELKKSLVEKGHRFATNSDTEVVIHLYEEYGEECLSHLRGMYAFGIWDSRKQIIMLARDRIGKKPLFYSHNNKNLIFASEIKSILEDHSIPKKVNHKAIYYYNTFNYVPSPHTAFEGIYKLPPAHFLIYENGDIRIKKYWELDYRNKFEIKSRIDREHLEEEIRIKIEEATKIRLISDVPVGAFLSGGIDSSAVVAYASKHSREKLKTFSIRFNESDYDESSYARLIAEKFGTEHYEFTVKPDAMEIVNKLVYQFDEPFADSSSIPTYYVSKLAREHVTVALTGDGGDESFAGYPRYAANNISEILGALPLYRKIMGSKWIRDKANNYQRYSNPVTKVLRLLNTSSLEDYERYYKWISWNHNNKLFTKEFEENVGVGEGLNLIMNLFSNAKADSVIDKSLSADINMYLPDDLLVKVDIASMANSLEVRCPLLDNKLMEFAARIPANMKTRYTDTKYILKKALEPILPNEVLYRKKMGFGLPIEHWFRNELKDLIFDILLSQRSLSRGYYNKSYIEEILNEHMKGTRNYRFEIWNLLVLELWHQNFIDR